MYDASLAFTSSFRFFFVFQDVASILCPTTPPPPSQHDLNDSEHDKNERMLQEDSKNDMPEEIEIPLPPLPAAQDKVFIYFGLCSFKKNILLNPRGSTIKF